MNDDRRRLLGLLIGSAATALVRPLFADTPVSATRLTDRLLLFTGAGGNVVVFDGADGLWMINGGRREQSAALLASIAEQCRGKRVHTLINTDWHPDHTGCNEALAARGARIVAHENTKQYLAADLFVDWENHTYPRLPAKALPTETIDTTAKVNIDGEPIEYGHLGQAHTDGDLSVFFRASNVLVAGDVLSVGRYPIADYTTGGWLGGLIAANKTLLDLANADTRIVPGSGPVQRRADLQAQHDMLTALRERIVKMMRQGMGADEMLAAGVTKEFDARWGAPTVWVPTVYRGLWLHVRELGGIV
jgi:cyclase